jgi:alanyl-tRNA synthetase
MTSNEIRASFLDFFASRGHRVVASSPLVPANDPTLMFTNAGMNQFKDVFLGRERRDYRRAASSQKCMRVSGKHNDLENVGPSPRHHTFFEMLGNFSFGDYFKAEAIELAWTLLTEVWKLPADRLVATVFEGDESVPRDDEAYELWRKYLPADRIVTLGKEDNFWSMGAGPGPCGRCSEVHYFRGNHLPCPEPVCQGVACSCDRYMEIWNNVFMEFDRQADDSLKPLPAPSIDTGMGLERITAVLQGVFSNYDTDLFTPLLSAISTATGIAYGGTMGANDVSMRVIADHVRAATFLIADHVVPSNEFRGYTLRKIMRRAMRHGKHLGMKEPFLHTLVKVLADQMGDAYPELQTQREYVERMILSEEQRFDTVLTTGLPRLEEVLDRSTAAGILKGDEAFVLYDTFGVPKDFIQDMAEERKLTFDEAGFNRAMEAQKEKARAQSAFGTHAREASAFEEATERLRGTPDEFEGYHSTKVQGVPVLAILDEEAREVEALSAGQAGYLALGQTPFYVESGGQVSDRGVIEALSGDGFARVDGLVKAGTERPRLHHVVVERGQFRARDLVSAEVDEATRDAIRRNHTATHLLHAALRHVLGGHVKQSGSLVSPERLRFDFVHYAPVTPEQVEEIERLVNAQILRNTSVETEVRSTEEAMASGAMALFGEKYGDRVRVVSVPGFSKELCGGTHVSATGDIGSFTIVQEAGVAAGIRRVEAFTGEGAIRLAQERRRQLDEILGALKTSADQAVPAIERLQAEAKRLAKENSQLKMKVAMGGGAATGSSAGGDEAVDAGGVRLIARRVQGLDKTGLGQLADTLKNQVKSGVVVVVGENEGRVSIVVGVTKDLVPKIHAGNIVKKLAPLVGGGGGGRPDFAEAGGKNPAGIDDLLKAAPGVVGEMNK